MLMTESCKKPALAGFFIGQMNEFFALKITSLSFQLYVNPLIKKAIEKCDQVHLYSKNQANF